MSHQPRAVRSVGCGGMSIQRLRIERVDVRPLSVPLVDPFVIASARVEETQSVLVALELREEASGRRAVGMGEAAALPPVTDVDQPVLLAELQRMAERLTGQSISLGDDLGPAQEIF